VSFEQPVKMEDEQYFQPILSSQEEDNFQQLNTVSILSIPLLLGVGISHLLCCVFRLLKYLRAVLDWNNVFCIVGFFGDLWDCVCVYLAGGTEQM